MFDIITREIVETNNPRNSAAKLQGFQKIKPKFGSYAIPFSYTLINKDLQAVPKVKYR